MTSGNAPTFKKGLADKSAPKGSKVALEVEIEGNPKQVKTNNLDRFS